MHVFLAELVVSRVGPGRAGVGGFEDAVALGPRVERRRRLRVDREGRETKVVRKPGIAVLPRDAAIGRAMHARAGPRRVGRGVRHAFRVHGDRLPLLVLDSEDALPGRPAVGALVDALHAGDGPDRFRPRRIEGDSFDDRVARDPRGQRPRRASVGGPVEAASERAGVQRRGLGRIESERLDVAGPRSDRSPDVGGGSGRGKRGRGDCENEARPCAHRRLLCLGNPKCERVYQRRLIACRACAAPHSSLWAFCFAVSASAQSPSADWRTIETAHFRVHYPAPFEAWARHAAGLLEPIRGRVTAFVGWEPGHPIEVVVADPAADANGMALPYLDRPAIVLWTSPPPAGSWLSDFPDWTEILATHEVAHVVHLARPGSGPVSFLARLLPAPFGPLALGSPRWVFEGYATLIEGALTGSGRPASSLRAMVLRQLAIEGKLPPYAKLDGGGGWLSDAVPYLVGSAYLEWLAARAGEDSLRELWRRMASRFAGGFAASFEEVFGDSPEDLYDRFVAETTAGAVGEERRIQAEGLAAGELALHLEGGTSELDVSPDGTKLLARRDPTRRESYVAIWNATLGPDDAALLEASPAGRLFGRRPSLDAGRPPRALLQTRSRRRRRSPTRSLSVGPSGTRLRRPPGRPSSGSRAARISRRRTRRPRAISRSPCAIASAFPHSRASISHRARRATFRSARVRPTPGPSGASRGCLPTGDVSPRSCISTAAGGSESFPWTAEISASSRWAAPPCRRPPGAETARSCSCRGREPPGFPRWSRSIPTASRSRKSGRA